MEVCFYCKEIIQENSAFIIDLFGENDCLKKYHVDCHQERTNIYKYNEKLNEVEVKNVTKKSQVSKYNLHLFGNYLFYRNNINCNNFSFKAFLRF